MKTLVLAMVVSLVSVFAAVAHGSTLRPGTYYVDQVEGGVISAINVRTLSVRTVHVSYTVRESATLIVMAPMVIIGHVSVPALASVGYKGAGTRYKGGIVTIGEIGTHGGWQDTSDVLATDVEYVASRCESVGPRLDGTYVTICDGLVVSVDDGVHAHLMPFGDVAANAQIGRR